MQAPDFDFAGNCNKRSRENMIPSISSSKKRRRVPKTALIHVRNLGTPLICGSTGATLDSFRLEPDRPYTIGRSSRSCDFLLSHSTVSRKHCQILFDSKTHNLYITDGVIRSDRYSFSSVIDEHRRKSIRTNGLDSETEEPGLFEARVSSNGVFVNSVRISKGLVWELLVGDEVLFAFGSEGLCNKRVLIGFVVKGIVYEERSVSGSEERTWLHGQATPSGYSQGTMSGGKKSKRVLALRENDIAYSVFESALKCVDVYKRIKLLLSHCRHVLHSADPISCLRLSTISDSGKECRFCSRTKLPGSDAGKVAKIPISCEVERFEPDPEKEPLYARRENAGQRPKRPLRCASKSIEVLKPIRGIAKDSCYGDADTDKDKTLFSNFGNMENTLVFASVNKEKTHPCPLPSPGKNFYLNRLQFMDQSSLGHQGVVSLPELLRPVENICQIFIATFTGDILWFLSCCDIPCHLPVTIACHNTERCWSSRPDARITIPYPSYPNLNVVFPLFPEDIAFGKDRKKQGIVCHHPKLIILQREDSIRVIITSANLVAKQWNSVTNTIWWQDFPRREEPDFLSLFAGLPGEEANKALRSDFAAQLAGFVASLLIDVPSQAHWIFELTKYTFEGATGHLVASVPGIHSYKMPYLAESVCFKSDTEFLGSVEASVVGLSYLFRATNDSKGRQLKKLASFLSKSHVNSLGMLEIVLRRNANVPADANAVSVLISDPNDGYGSDCVQLGFLPRNISKWVSPLWDIGFFRFLGFVHRDEALGAASGRTNQKVQLRLLVLQGPSIRDILKMLQPLHIAALCSLVASVQRCTGIWRLQEVLGKYKWPESQESDFIYSSSSIGSSVNAEFLAAFSAAAGKKALQNFDSQESDPEWGSWNASHESKGPSIRIIFPTIERVKNACDGVWPSRRILCFSEKTWLRLRHFGILHDAVPHPLDRVGHPMHVKVARRQFNTKKDSSSVGWVYCGSHNFSAAAWGQTIYSQSHTSENESHNTTSYSYSSSSGSSLRICNYELGIIFIFPPPEGKSSCNKDMARLDDIVLPFAVPPPKYGPSDRPATAQAMREALVELNEQSRRGSVETKAAEEMIDEEIAEEEDEVVETSEFVAEKEEEKAYAETLWGQVNFSLGR